MVALNQHGNAASNFDVLDGAAKFGFRFGKGFAVFEGDDAGEIVEIFFEEIFQFKEILNALAGRSTAPSRESIGGGLNGGGNVRGRREGCTRQQLGGGGIGDVGILCRGGSSPSAGYIVLKNRDLGGYGTAHT